jgi:hypothetical protein
MRNVETDELLNVSGGVLTTSDILDYLRPGRNEPMPEWNGTPQIPSPENAKSRIAAIGFFAITAFAAIFSGAAVFRR